MNRYPFGDGFCGPGQTEDEIFYNFFRAYLQMCARLLQVDADTLSRSMHDGAYESPLLSFKHFRHINAISTGAQFQVPENPQIVEGKSGTLGGSFLNYQSPTSVKIFWTMIVMLV